MRARVTSILNQYGWSLLGVVLLIAGGIYYTRDTEPPPIEYRVVRGPFERAVSVSGKVIAADSVELAFSQSGRIERLLVAVGTRVESGDLLAELENDDVRALIAQRSASLSGEEAALRSLEAGARPEEIAVSESAVRTAEVARDQALQAMIEEIQDAYRVADDAVRIKADSYITNPRTQPALSFITADTQTKVAVENARTELESRLTRWERDVFTLTPLSDVRAALLRAQEHLVAIAAFLVDARTVISKGLTTGTVTDATLATYAADTAAARSTVNTSITALTTADTSLKSAEATLETAKRNLDLKRAGATLSALEEQQARLEVARASLTDAEAQLRRTRVRAPFPGVITRVSAEVGEVASGQQPIFTLISDGELEIESYIPEIYIADIGIGDMAVIELDAYGDALQLPAKVFAIEPAETVRDGVATYRTLLHLDTRDERVRPGMTASIAITTDLRAGVLSVPVGFVKLEEEGTVVSVRSGNEVVRRPVTTGESSLDGFIEIVSGVVEGDVVLDIR